MRLRLLLCAALLASALVTSSGAAANLLQDPSFESIPAGTTHASGEHNLGGWRFYTSGTAGGTFTAVTPGRTGNIAARLTRSGWGGDSGLDVGLPSLLIPVEGQATYRMGFFARTPSSSAMILTFVWLNGSGTKIGQNSFIVRPGAEYTNVSREAQAPSAAASLNILIQIQGPGEVTVDDAELVQSAGPPPPADVFVTWPVNETVDSLTPAIAFAAPAANGFEAVLEQDGHEVQRYESSGGQQRTFQFPAALAAGQQYSVKVRMLYDAWTTWTAPAVFQTPQLPLVKIKSPVTADQAWGPQVEVKWDVEAGGSSYTQRVRVDGGAWEAVPAGTASHQLHLSDGLHTVDIEAASSDGTAVASSEFYVISTPAEGGTLYYYDASWVAALNMGVMNQRKLQWDALHAVAALQGLLNRNGTRLWVKLYPQDDVWLNILRQPHGWLSKKQIVHLPTGAANLPQLFTQFRDEFEGVVLWDPNVLATSNVATTVAGAEDLIPVRYDLATGSVYQRLVSGGPKLPVKLDLRNRFTGTGTIWETAVPSTGSAKCDAYIWALEKYLKTGVCTPDLLLYSVDSYWQNEGMNLGNQLVNRDYIIQHRGFVFDLGVWDDEKPVDDPDQPLGTDLETLKRVLYECASRSGGMVHLVGFVPWPFKYTTWSRAGGTHDPVPTEWEAARIFSHYNVYMDADTYGYADLANASIHSQFPLPDRLTQNGRPTLESLRRQGYIGADRRLAPINFVNFYMGDYDAGSWMASIGYNLWNNAVRGTIPVSWAFNPNHIKRVTSIYAYYNRTRSPLDSFIAGDCGAGYVNPSLLFGERISGLPEADDIWVEHNLHYFRRTNTKTSGFLINGYAGPLGQNVDRMYERFSGEGVFSQPHWYPGGPHISGSMPALIIQRDLTKNMAQDIDIVAGHGHQSTRFLSYRIVLESPQYIKSVFDGAASRDPAVQWRLVDTFTYAALQSSNLTNPPSARATYTFDTIPSRITAVASVEAAVGVRNDAWDTWQATGAEAVRLKLEWISGGAVVQEQVVDLTADVPEGAAQVLKFNLTLPPAGPYTLRYQMFRGESSFSDLGDYSWEKEVTIQAQASSPGEARLLPPHTPVALAGVVANSSTTQLRDAIYVSAPDRSSGIRVVLQDPQASISEGDVLQLSGIIEEVGAELAIVDASATVVGGGNPLAPLGISGKDSALEAPVGLLVRMWGRVAPSLHGDDAFELVDGSQGPAGVTVLLGPLVTEAIKPPEPGEWFEVTGLLGREPQSRDNVPVLRVRRAEDLQPVDSQEVTEQPQPG